MTTLEVTRRRKLLTQVALAKQAGIASSTVYLIERADPSYHPRLSVIRKICTALGVDPADVDEFRNALELTDSQ